MTELWCGYGWGEEMNGEVDAVAEAEADDRGLKGASLCTIS